MTDIKKLQALDVQARVQATQQEEEETEYVGGLLPYRPMSAGTSLEVSTPSGMAYEIRQSLLRLRDEVYDIDWYVTKKLKYTNPQELYKYFSAEQIDALALGIYNSERGEGIIVGDQTGIGKGRIAAGMLRYAAKNGKPGIFFTVSSSLFSDIYRDLFDIGTRDLVPLVINTGDKEALITIQLDADTSMYLHEMDEYQGDQRYQPKTYQQLKSLIEGRESMPKGYDIVLVTYSQVSSDMVAKEALLGAKNSSKKVKENGSQWKPDFVSAVASGAVIIMDEAHKAAGSDSIIGQYFKTRVLNNCDGCLYLSATFAKRPDNMPVFAIKTSISHTNLSSEGYKLAFEKGGVALQEIVAGELAKSGQMVRRERSIDPDAFEYVFLDEDAEKHKVIYDAVARLVQRISQFERDYITPKIAEIKKVYTDPETKALSKGLGDRRSEFFSSAHNLVRQVFFAIKANEVAQAAIRLLNDNKKVVIAFARTMASQIQQLGLSNGDVVENDSFQIIFKKNWDKARQYSIVEKGEEKSAAKEDDQNQSDEDGATIDPNSKVVQSWQFELEDFEPEAQAEYLAIEEDITSLSQLDMSISPIDVLINTIQAAKKPAYVDGHENGNYIVHECTGRSMQLRRDGKDLVYRNYKANKVGFFADFNRGDADVLLINQSSATGVSAHSSAKFKDKRQRVMIIHEPELDVNIEVQKWGRIDRTGQVNRPKYYYYSTSIAGEKRLFMVLKGKLRSLFANTSGNQKASDTQLESPDFFNRFGDKATRAWLDANIDIAYKVRLSKEQMEDAAARNWRDKNAGADLVNGIAEKFARYIAFLETDEQDRAYSEILSEYDGLINEAKSSGTYDLEAEYIDLKAEVLERSIFVLGTGKKSPFGRHAVNNKVSARVTKRPMSFIKVQEAIILGLKGGNVSSIAPFVNEFVNEYKQGRAALLDSKLADLSEKMAELQEKNASRQAEYEKKLAKYEAVKAKGEEGEKELKALEVSEASVKNTLTKISDLEDNIDAARAKIISETNNGVSVLNFFYPGRPVVYDDQQGVTHNMVVTSVEYVKKPGESTRYNAANIVVKCAVYGPDRTRTMKLNDDRISRCMAVTQATPTDYLENILYNWNKSDESGGRREERNIINNNILLAIGKAAEGKLVRYTSDKGALLNGILLPPSDKTATGVPKKIKTLLPLNKGIDKVTSLGKNELFFPSSDFHTVKEPHFNGAGSAGVYFNLPSTSKYKTVWGNEVLIDLILQSESDKNAGLPKAFQKYTGNLFTCAILMKNVPEFVEELYRVTGWEFESGSIAYVETDDAPLPEVTDDRVVTISRYILSDTTKEIPTIQGYLGQYDENGKTIVEFIDLLSTKEKIEYGLQPYFKNMHESVSNWYRVAKSNGVPMPTIPDQYDYDAMIQTLSEFLAANRNEAGNREFEFGPFSFRVLATGLLEVLKGRKTSNETLKHFKSQLTV